MLIIAIGSIYGASKDGLVNFLEGVTGLLVLVAVCGFGVVRTGDVTS